MSALAFRNVNVSPDDPVASWPQEAIQTALERGGLQEWSRIVEEIGSDPWGRCARGVEEVLSFSRPYGVAELMERVIADARRAAEEAERAAVATEVKELVARSGLSRAEFASRIGTSASRLSTYATGKVTPSAALLVRMHRIAPDPHDDRRETRASRISRRSRDPLKGAGPILRPGSPETGAPWPSQMPTG